MPDSNKSNNTRITNAILATKLDILIEEVKTIKAEWRRELTSCQERGNAERHEHATRIGQLESTQKVHAEKFKAVQRDQTAISGVFSTIGAVIAAWVGTLRG